MNESRRNETMRQLQSIHSDDSKRTLESHVLAAGVALMLASASCHQAPAGRELIASRQQAAPSSSARAPGQLLERKSQALADDRDGADREELSREAYAAFEPNPFLLPGQDPLSTFSIDVDTASYSNVRRMLRAGDLPPASAVRIEEFLNYFPYDYSPPADEHPLAVHSEVFGCPWEPTHRLLRVAVQGAPREASERPAANLVFLIDVSGSMGAADKLPLLTRSLGRLVEELDEDDRVAMVVYAGASGVVLEPTSCDAKDTILQALERLSAGGSTNGGAGIELAYRVASESFIADGINRVILATDGDFNVGTSSEGELVRMIEQKAQSGVGLTVLGFGTGNLQDSKMEQLSGHGNGNYAYIDSELEARKVLVEELGATLETIASDVKIQVEFNPLAVAGYRLLGYENRLLAARDFADDSKDAGEIGAGHRVTALYEVVPAGAGIEVPGIDPLRYQSARHPSGAAFTNELCQLQLRYKPRFGAASKLMVAQVDDAGTSFHEASADTRFATAVAAFALVLRDSPYRGDVDLDRVLRWATDSVGADEGGYRRQFVELVRRASSLQKGS